MITGLPTMRRSGLAIKQGATTGAGILPGIITLSAGMIPGTIPGTILGIIADGMTPGTTAMLAGIHLGITVLAGIGVGVPTIIIPVTSLSEAEADVKAVT